MGSTQAETIRERYGTADDPNKFWREQGAKGGAKAGGRPFKDPEIAREAQRKSVESRRLRKEAEAQSE